jgi:steroid delta-isomerase-like uncharacterized protein
MGLPTATETQQQLVERFYYKGWNKRDEKVMTEILDENIKFRGALGKKKPRGHEAFLEYMRSAHTALGNHLIEIEDITLDPEHQKAAVRIKSRGIHKSDFFGVKGSGHEVAWSNAAFFKFTADGKISELWVLGDIDDLKHQIGATSESSAF